MRDQPILLSDMIPQVMSLLEGYGYEKHTLWGSMYGVFSSIKTFYAEQAITNYDPEITKAFVARARNRYESGTISRPFFYDQCRAAKWLDEFYLTGRLEWSWNRPQSKFELNEEYSNLLDMF